MANVSTSIDIDAPAQDVWAVAETPFEIEGTAATVDGPRRLSWGWRRSGRHHRTHHRHALGGERRRAPHV